MLECVFTGRNTMSPLMAPIDLDFLFSTLPTSYTTVSSKKFQKKMELIIIFKVVGIYESASTLAVHKYP